MLLQCKFQPPAKPQVLIFAWLKRLGEFGWDLRLGRFRIALRRKVSVYPDLALRRALRLYTRRTGGDVCVFLMTFGAQTGRIGCWAVGRFYFSLLANCHVLPPTLHFQEKKRCEKDQALGFGFRLSRVLATRRVSF